MQVIVNGEPCYMQSQCREARIQATTEPGMRALRLCASHPYAWPGGYPHYVVTADGGALCHDCVKAEYKLVYRSTRDDLRDGWTIAGIDINWEDADLLCDHCGKGIESAY